MRGTVVVFGKAPQRGRVKRRLARDVGEAAAFHFYRQQLARTLRVAQGPWRTVLALTPDGARWPGHKVMAQGRGDLGRRMARWLRPGRCTALVGGDVPGITRADLRRALQGRLAFGPAADGGFWLVATGRGGLPRGAFRAVRWSTAHALGDVLRNLPRAVRPAFGRTLRDVDHGPDLHATAPLRRAGG